MIFGAPGRRDVVDHRQLLVGAVAGEDHGKAKVEVLQSGKVMLQAFPHTLGRGHHDRPRIVGVTAADALVHGGHHHAAVGFRRRQAQALGIQGVQPDRQNQAAQRQVGHRAGPTGTLEIRRGEVLHPYLGHARHIDVQSPLRGTMVSAYDRSDRPGGIRPSERQRAACRLRECS